MEINKANLLRRYGRYVPILCAYKMIIFTKTNKKQNCISSSNPCKFRALLGEFNLSVFKTQYTITRTTINEY